jgi:hypothetical protein
VLRIYQRKPGYSRSAELMWNASINGLLIIVFAG